MNITEEQKNNILEECLNTKRTYRVIARENRVNYEDVIAIIEEYCQKRGYKSLGRKQNGDVFKRTMEKITEIEELLRNFGSVEKILEATDEEISQIKGINKQMAQKIKKELKKM